MLAYSAPGPVAARFWHSRAKVQTLQGPVGSGKTILNLMKGIKRAGMQPTSKRDGRRYYKLTIVRDTYRQLWRSTIRSWWKWMPKETGTWKGGQDEPAVHHFQVAGPDQTICDIIYEFVAIGDNDVEEFMRGYEPTDWYLNEADLLAEDVFESAVTRLGRYPDPSHALPIETCVMMDANAPDVDSWLYNRGLMGDEDWWDYFNQPGADSPKAENLQNLPEDYYSSQIKILQDKRKIRKYVFNRPSYSLHGKPVYEEFNGDIHAADRYLEPLKGLPIGIGVDAGGTPAAVFGQRMPNGQWRIIDELVTDPKKSCGARRFGEKVAKRLAERFPGWPVYACADPSADYEPDKEQGELSWLRKFAKASGLTVRSAPSNNIEDRLEAVRAPLERMIDGQYPGLLLSKRCRELRKGFESTYQYRKMLISGSDRWTDKPDKGGASHVHDALQYLMLTGGEKGEIAVRSQEAARWQSGGTVIDEENPHGFDWDDGPATPWGPERSITEQRRRKRNEEVW